MSVVGHEAIRARYGVERKQPRNVVIDRLRDLSDNLQFVRSWETGKGHARAVGIEQSDIPEGANTTVHTKEHGARSDARSPHIVYGHRRLQTKLSWAGRR